MSIITNEFVGKRLTDARLARGKSATDLADMLGVSTVSISKYENGHQKPKIELLFKICSELNFPKEYFTRPCLEQDPQPIFWRGKLSASVNMQERAHVRMSWFKEIVDYLSNYFDFPQLNIPDFSVEDINLLQEDSIDNIAMELRRYWSIRPGPMPNILEKMESNGILISRIHVRADKLDAFSQWSDRLSLPVVVLGRDKSSACRQRFDALHELAHLVLHRLLKTHKKLNNRTTYKLIESQADKLASSLLLPAEEFAYELYSPSLDSFLMLKERWGVSVAAMIMRCKSLGIINDNQSTLLWKNYARRGWRKNEPLDNKLIKETPQLIKKSFEILLSEKILTVDEIKTALPFPVNDLEEITGVDIGTFGGDLNSDDVLPVLKEGIKKSLSDHNVINFQKK